jgi:hypothetical protein
MERLRRRKRKAAARRSATPKTKSLCGFLAHVRGETRTPRHLRERRDARGPLSRGPRASPQGGETYGFVNFAV